MILKTLLMNKQMLYSIQTDKIKKKILKLKQQMMKIQLTLCLGFWEWQLLLDFYMHSNGENEKKIFTYFNLFKIF